MNIEGQASSVEHLNLEGVRSFMGEFQVGSDIEDLALSIWQEHEMAFEPRLRRMRPDDIDIATGAWDRVLILALERSGTHNN